MSVTLPVPRLPDCIIFHKLSILSLNVFSMEKAANLLRVVADKQFDVLCLTEINLRWYSDKAWGSRDAFTQLCTSHNYNVMYAYPQCNATSPGSPWIRAAQLYKKGLRVIRQHKWEGGVICTYDAGMTLDIATFYAKPWDAAATREGLRQCEAFSSGLPLVLAGDLNITTNGPVLQGMTWLQDVTPPEATYSTSNTRGDGTRPDAVFVNARAHELFVEVATGDRQTYQGCSDHHWPHIITVRGSATKPLSVRALMRKLESINQLVQDPTPRPVAVEVQSSNYMTLLMAYVKRKDLASHSAAAQHFPTLLLPKTLQHSRATVALVRERLLDAARTVSHQPKIPWSERIAPKYRVPPPAVARVQVTREDGSVHVETKTSFAEVQKAFCDFWGNKWSRSESQQWSVPSFAFPWSGEVRAVMSKPIAAEEIKRVVKTIKNQKSTADFRPEQLKALLDEDTNVQVLASLLSPEFCAHKPVHTHVALPPKVEGATVAEHRPLGSCQLWRTVVSKVMNLRVNAAKIPWHPNNYTYRKGLATSDPVVALHAAITQLGDSPFAVFVSDVVKAFDSIIHEAIDQALKEYGLYNEYTAYLARQFFYVLVLAGGTTHSIRVMRGLIQGDPLSTIVFKVLADMLCRMIEHDSRIPRNLLFTQFVDDMNALVLDNVVAAALDDISARFWRGLGASMGKYRLIATEGWQPLVLGVPTPLGWGPATSIEIVPKTSGLVLGCCVHCEKQPKPCPVANKCIEEVRRRIRSIHETIPDSLQRGRMLEALAMPVITAWPSPCIRAQVSKLQDLQKDLDGTFVRGMSNVYVHTKGMKDGYHVPAKAGGRNIPDVGEALRLATIRVVRMAAACPTMSSAPTLAAMSGTQPTHSRNIIGKCRRDLRDKGLSMATGWQRPVGSTLWPWLPLPLITCCDASFERSTGKATVGLATDSATYTINLKGKFTSSYQAEMAGNALVGLSARLSVPGPGGRRTCLNDNLGGVKHLQRITQYPMSMHHRMSVNNCAAALALTVGDSVALEWVKGHVEQLPTAKEVLNNKADQASRQVHHDWEIDVRELHTVAPGMLLTASGDVVGNLHHLFDQRTEAMYTKWSQLTPMACVHRPSVAFYYHTKTGATLLSAACLEDLLAVRMRTLFPRKDQHRRKCVCGGDMDPQLQHLMKGCQYHGHTATPITITQKLRAELGAGWWNPPCFAVGLQCTCRVGAFSCLHIFMCFAPKGRCTEADRNRGRRAQFIWAQYLHARLAVCHPANSRDGDDPTRNAQGQRNPERDTDIDTERE